MKRLDLKALIAICAIAIAVLFLLQQIGPGSAFQIVMVALAAVILGATLWIAYRYGKTGSR